MRISGGKLCVLAWTVAGIVQLVFFMGLPEKIVIEGVDLTDANRLVQIHGLLFVGLGLLLSIVGLMAGAGGPLIAVASAALYLAYWFPFGLVYKYGLIGASKMMWVVGSNPGFRLTSTIRDVVLPIVFTVAIVLVLREWRRAKR